MHIVRAPICIGGSSMVYLWKRKEIPKKRGKPQETKKTKKKKKRIGRRYGHWERKIPSFVFVRFGREVKRINLKLDGYNIACRTSRFILIQAM